jgi:hypothetical protein
MFETTSGNVTYLPGSVAPKIIIFYFGRVGVRDKELVQAHLHSANASGGRIVV